MSKYDTRPEWQRKTQELCQLESGLSDKEVDFVEKLSHLPMSTRLSKAQLDWLDAIYSRQIR